MLIFAAGAADCMPVGWLFDGVAWPLEMALFCLVAAWFTEAALLCGVV